MKEHDTEPDVVPDKIKSSFNYKAIIVILVLVISFHVLINYFVVSDDADTLVSIFSFEIESAKSLNVDLRIGIHPSSEINSFQLTCFSKR